MSFSVFCCFVFALFCLGWGGPVLKFVSLVWGVVWFWGAVECGAVLVVVAVLSGWVGAVVWGAVVILFECASAWWGRVTSLMWLTHNCLCTHWCISVWFFLFFALQHSLFFLLSEIVNLLAKPSCTIPGIHCQF